MGQIKSQTADNYVWVSSDETTDILGRCVVNVVFGILRPTIAYTQFVIECHISTSVNTQIISSVTDNC